MIDTAKRSETLRARAINVSEQKILVSRLKGSAQEADISDPVNCGGFGRIRHFRRQTSPGWPPNPLPIDPAAHKLGLQPGDLVEAQVFQNAACNWRCWYCFVPFSLLAADPNKSAWLKVGELLDFYEALNHRPKVIDLSGGQPDLTPEWVPWMMRELQRRGLDKSVYLWSDDNLSTDYFWRFLTDDDRKLIQSFSNYGKVCCFKGFDAESFAFNTGAAATQFDLQFDLFRRYVDLHIDLYAYATFTSINPKDVPGKMRLFVDRLQQIHPNLPLRTVPLEIRPFSVTQPRIRSQHEAAMKVQQEAIECWNKELQSRFSDDKRQKVIYEVML